MPNWCENKVTIYGPLERLQELKKATQENRLLQHIKPMPDELKGTVSPTPKDSNPKDVEVLQEKYGASNWYDWRVNNWGTKWDVGDVFIDEEQSNLRPAMTSLFLSRKGHRGEVIDFGTHNGINFITFQSRIVDPNLETPKNRLTLTFDTAWSPPNGCYDQLHRDGMEVSAIFCEFGCDFIGGWFSDSDENGLPIGNYCLGLSDIPSKFFKEDRWGQELDSVFHILDWRESMEEDE